MLQSWKAKTGAAEGSDGDGESLASLWIQDQSLPEARSLGMSELGEPKF